MKVTINRKPNDKVWFMDDGVPKCGTIVSVFHRRHRMFSDLTENTVSYEICVGGDTIVRTLEDRNVYDTLDGLLDSL